MAERVVLHIGTMKSGTSYLQSVLARNLDALRASGYRFLGGAFRAQSRAVREVLSEGSDTRWRALAERAHRPTGRVPLVSMEFLSFAREEALDTLLRPLQGLDVDVVLTVRDQFRALPAQWQTYARNTGTASWAAYLREIGAYHPVRGARSRAFRTFHRAQDVPTILDRWSGHPAVRSVTVVTVPPPGAPRQVLWDRFAVAVGIEAEMAFDGLKENVSLGYASCDFLRRLNQELGLGRLGDPGQDFGELRPHRYTRVLRPIAREVLLPLRPDEGRPELDRAAAGYARLRNEEFRTTLRRGGLPIVGSLEDLPVHDDPAGRPETVVPPSEEHVRKAALAVRQHLLGETERGSVEGQSVTLEELVVEVARLLRPRLERPR